MPGPPPKPTVLKVLGGNAGKRALPKGEPQPERGIPDCPEFLSERGRACWADLSVELDKINVLTMLDAYQLAVMADAWADFLDARDQVRGDDAILETESGYKLPSPWVAIRNKARDTFNSLAKEFGMTPASRTRISVEPKPVESDFDKFRKKGKGA